MLCMSASLGRGQMCGQHIWLGAQAMHRYLNLFTSAAARSTVVNNPLVLLCTKCLRHVPSV